MTLPWNDFTHRTPSCPLSSAVYILCLLKAGYLLESWLLPIAWQFFPFPIITWCKLVVETSSKLGPPWVIKGTAQKAHTDLWDAHTQKEPGCGLSRPRAASGLFWKAPLPAGLQICLSRSDQRPTCRRWEEQDGNQTHGYLENRILTTTINETSSWRSFVFLSWLPNTRQGLQS